jgi:hypothetical protein
MGKDKNTKIYIRIDATSCGIFIGIYTSGFKWMKKIFTLIENVAHTSSHVTAL